MRRWRSASSAARCSASARLRQILVERRDGGAAIVQSSHRGEHDAGPPDAIWRLREGSVEEERS